jgi:hypothetical protein
VAAWYIMAAKYIVGRRTKVAYVSTNSVAQGQQVSVLWNELFTKYKVKIHFAHHTFRWWNEARGNAAVHVVIIGFASYDVAQKLIYEYDSISSEPHEINAANINPYLVEGNDVVIPVRSRPLCNVPPMLYGSKPVDDGNFLFTDDEKVEFLRLEPQAEKYFRPLLSAKEYLSGRRRWCLWLKDALPNELRAMPRVMARIEAVKRFRLESDKAPTRQTANTSTLFAEIRQPGADFILIPLHSSETRKYIPFGFFSKDFVAHNSISIVPNATLFHFGIISSVMHMTWVRYMCGRIKSDYRYSGTVVYNNFPFPIDLNKKQQQAVERAAQKVLDARIQFPDSSPADLYDPLSMPAVLVKAHQELDKAVDLCYRPQPFLDETKRIEFLFELYEKYASGMFVAPKVKKSRR